MPPNDARERGGVPPPKTTTNEELERYPITREAFEYLNAKPEKGEPVRRFPLTSYFPYPDLLRAACWRFGPGGERIENAQISAELLRRMVREDGPPVRCEAGNVCTNPDRWTDGLFQPVEAVLLNTDLLEGRDTRDEGDDEDAFPGIAPLIRTMKRGDEGWFPIRTGNFLPLPTEWKNGKPSRWRVAAFCGCFWGVDKETGNTFQQYENRSCIQGNRLAMREAGVNLANEIMSRGKNRSSSDPIPYPESLAFAGHSFGRGWCEWLVQTLNDTIEARAEKRRQDENRRQAAISRFSPPPKEGSIGTRLADTSGGKKRFADVLEKDSRPAAAEPLPSANGNNSQ